MRTISLHCALPLILAIAIVSAGGNLSRAASCRAWSIEGFYLGMMEDEARSVLAKDDFKAERDRDFLKFEITRNKPGRVFRGELRISEGIVSSGWMDLTAAPAETAGSEAESLIGRFGKPRRETTEQEDTHTSRLVREWVDSDCGLSLLMSQKGATLHIELRPESDFRREEAARAAAERARADRLAAGSPCSPEPLDSIFLDVQPILVAGTVKPIELPPDAPDHLFLDISFLVRADGSVGEVKIVRADPAKRQDDPAIVKAVTKALEARKYVPGTCGGRAVSTRLTQAVEFVPAD